MTSSRLVYTLIPNITTRRLEMSFIRHTRFDPYLFITSRHVMSSQKMLVKNEHIKNVSQILCEILLNFSFSKQTTLLTRYVRNGHNGGVRLGAS